MPVQYDINPDPNAWLTAEHIAACRPGVAIRTIKTLAQNGELPYTQRGMGATARRLFRLSDVDALLDSHVVPARKGPLAARGSAK